MKTPPQDRPESRRRRIRKRLVTLHSDLRTEGGTPARTAFAVALGIWVGCLPLFGLHLLLCTVLARVAGLSRLKAYAAAHLNNPLTMPFLLYLEYGVGHWLRQREWPAVRLSALHAQTAWKVGFDLLLGSVVVGLVLGVLFGLAAYFLARKRRLPPIVDQLFEEVERRYLRVGIFHWEFVRSKLRWDPMYRAFALEDVLPTEGRIVDIGCGRGIALSLALARREFDPAAPRHGSAPLELHGIELRPRLAAVARRALGDAASIRRGDAGRAEDTILPTADRILLLDVLHYLDAESQVDLLARVAEALAPGGELIVREADAVSGWRFSATRTAERLCAVARGHFDQRFFYRSRREWREILERAGLEVDDRPLSDGTPFSNHLIRARRSPGDRPPGGSDQESGPA